MSMLEIVGLAAIYLFIIPGAYVLGTAADYCIGVDSGKNITWALFWPFSLLILLMLVICVLFFAPFVAVFGGFAKLQVGGCAALSRTAKQEGA